MKAYPYLVNKDSTGERLQTVEAHLYNEAWLQELLRKHPEILPVDEIEPVFHPLIPIGREVATDTGYIDNLFISHSGYLVLVETKLWRNPEAKREVVAQAIDYSSSLSKWDYKHLDDVARAYTKEYEGSKQSLLEWVERQSGPVEKSHEYFEDVVVKNLKLGRFLTLIVGDRIKSSVADMLSYINKYPHMAISMALVELNCFHEKEGQDWPLLVVPSIVAQTRIVERSVIQVTVKSEGAYEVEVQQEIEKEGRKGVTLTEEAFWELLKAQSPNNYTSAHTLINKYKEDEKVTVDPTESSVVVKFGITDSGEQVSLFFIDKKAQLHIWPNTIRQKLEKAGLNPGLADSYESTMRRILKAGEHKEFTCPIEKVDVGEFIAAVDAFIETLRFAEPTD
jgi:hypothetical protein